MAWNFLVLVSLSYPFERLFPARDQLFFRKGFATDCVFYIMQHSVLEGGMLSLFTLAATAITSLNGVQYIHVIIGRQPAWFQLLVVILVADTIGYTYHRYAHRSRWLWPFHAVHHSVTEPDWLSAHREHPVDVILGSFSITLPFIILGVPMALASPLIIFRSIWSLYLHSNVDLAIGPLQVLIGSPQLHRWHHSLNHNRCNYSNYSPWLDVLLGTYHSPRADPDSFGIKDQIPIDYVSLFFHPFRRVFTSLRSAFSHAEKFEGTHRGDKPFSPHE